ncbi:hypothetical protein ACKWTF_004084 [Chironomus riparius]
MNSVQSSGNTTSLNRKKDSQFEELAISSTEKRNWRGICIALLVISAVLSIIVFSIFLLSPEIEDTRIYGRRLLLSDIYNDSLKWKSFNGSWINDKEFIFRNLENGISLFNAETLETKLLMDNSSFRRLNVDCYNISPDLNFILLYECQHDSDSNGTKYFVYEIFSTNIYPLTPNGSDEVELQKILWSPGSYDSSNLAINDNIDSISTNNNNNNIPSNTNNRQKKVLPNSKTKVKFEKSKLSQAIAFIHDYDIYYKPKIHSDLVIRVTINGKKDFILNGIQDWLYANTPELNGDTIAFSTNGSYLSFLSFNITNVEKYEYTWNGRNSQYPMIKSIRYPRYSTPNPNVTCFVVNLNVLKYINLIPLNLPEHLDGDFYIGNMFWISNTELTITYTSRDQTLSSTLLCTAPNFECTEIQRETNNEIGVDISPEKPIYLDVNEFAHALLSPSINSSSQQSSNNNRFLIKIYPVLDGKYGMFRQIALIPFVNKKPIGITIGRNEVTEILGWDAKNQAIYYMSAPEDRPGQRHLYKIVLEFQVLDSTSSDINIRPKTPVCLSCDNSIDTYDMNNTYNLNSFIREHNHNEKDIFVHVNHMIGKNKEPSESELIPNNCLFNRVHMSTEFSFHILECLGPDTPSIYLVDTFLARKIFIIDNGAELAQNVLELALPQVKTFSVEIRDGFHAQVRLFLPPMAKEDEEVSFPLILHIESTPSSQLVSEEFKVNWDHYLASQKSFIVAQIDGRGSGFQGEAFKSQIKGNVSAVDVEDQLTVLT